MYSLTNREQRVGPARDGEDHYWHDNDGEVRNVTCRFCDGSGGHPRDGGITPCEHCDGEGYEWWVTHGNA